MGIQYSPPAASGVAALPADHGFLGWTAPIAYSLSSSLLSVEVGAGTLRCVRVRRCTPSTVSNLWVYVATAGVTLSNCFAALFDSSGNLLGQTADQSTAWQSIGGKQMALVTPVAAAGDLIVGLWYNGTTAPTLQRTGPGSSSAQMNINQSGSAFNCFNADTGLTTAAPSVIGARTSSALQWWAAVS
jgi:hypothetical protein